METIGNLIKQRRGLDRFKGFLKPNTTPTPDEVFDRFLTELTHSELKVLMYIIRRTFGFRKEGDRISLNQIANGIVTKKGRRLDWGAGLSRRGAIKAVKNLEEKGLIIVKRKQNKDGYNQVNYYYLRFNNRG